MTYEWTVIGAGPAGIAAVGKLIDYGIEEKNIAWVDPKFKVGDLGTIWRNVPSNTKVKLFKKFLYLVNAFEYSQCPYDFDINHAEPEATCFLRVITDPLQWVSDHLRKKVTPIQDIAETLSLSARTWKIAFKNYQTIQSKNVILAIGAEPRTLPFSSPPVIPLQDAMDAVNLHHHISKNDTVAVFGSSHSAILVLQNCVANKVKHIINFYRSPLRYAVYLDGWILFDDSGLKGPTADWAREYIDGQLPENLIRVYSNQENIEHYLPRCNKVVYAVGFERRILPTIQDVGHVAYIEQCGIIAPGLFGLGIAFPQIKANKINLLEYRVGLWKFMEYLNDMLPIWTQYFS